MGILGLRKKGESGMVFVESVPYNKDNKEENLHRLIEKNPKLVVLEQEDGTRLPTAVIGSRMRLPSGEELDLLLMDAQGTLTLVELKGGKTAREVIAQILSYAADLNLMTREELERRVRQNTDYNSLEEVVKKLSAEEADSDAFHMEEVNERIEECLRGKKLQLLIVSYEVDEETKKIARFLRETYGMKIWCVEFDYFKNEEYEFFVPETIGVEEVRHIADKLLGPKQRAYKEFFGEILSRLKKEEPSIAIRPARPKYFCQLPIGRGNIHFEWAFHRKPKRWFEVGLHFERGSEEENRKLFASFEKIKDELQRELKDMELVFECPWGTSGAARIYIANQKTEMDEELKNWAVETMLKFYRVFKPRLDKILKDEG